MSMIFIGLDAGATRTRALVATASGDVVGSGRAAGANSWSSGTSVVESISDAILEAIRGHDPAAVARGVIAIAGGGATSPQVAAGIEAAWRAMRLRGRPDIVLDVLAAYAAGTSAAQGIVLAAGTGAIAAAVSGLRIERRAGGCGWMVGDEGSAVWLGIEGTRAALQALDGRGPETLLATAIPDALGVAEADAEGTARRIVVSVYSEPPARMGRLAPLVVEASEQGDGVAGGLVRSAADHLVEAAVAVHPEGQPAVIVLAGSLLIHAAPVRGLVEAALAERWPAALITETGSGEAGAVALAIARESGEPVDEATLARLREARPA